MKLMIRRTEKGLSAYAPKKDLEVPIVAVSGIVRRRVTPLGRR